MNILFFVDGGYNNGVGTLFIEQIKAIHRYNKNIFAVSSSKEQETNLIKSLRDDSISVLILKGLEYHQNFLEHVNLLTQYVLENKIHSAHVQTNWQLALVSIVKLRLLFKLNIKIIYTIHSYRNHKPLQSVFVRWIMSVILILFSDIVICTSSFLSSKFRFLAKKRKVLPLGVSQSFFEHDYKECPINGLHIVFSACFRYGKNQDILIRSFSNYIKETQDEESCLYLLGNGPLLESMKHLTLKLGIQNRVVFPGFCTKNQVVEFYNKCNIGIVSSNSETFGLCVIEPFVLGRCVITRHVGVADDIIKEYVNGYFFNNEKDLTKLLKTIHDNKYVLREIGHNNFKSREQFNWNKIAKQYLELINNL